MGHNFNLHHIVYQNTCRRDAIFTTDINIDTNLTDASTRQTTIRHDTTHIPNLRKNSPGNVCLFIENHILGKRLAQMALQYTAPQNPCTSDCPRSTSCECTFLCCFPPPPSPSCLVNANKVLPPTSSDILPPPYPKISEASILRQARCVVLGAAPRRDRRRRHGILR